MGTADEPGAPGDKDPAAVVWGVLGASRFALKKSVPRMLGGTMTSVRALASRRIERAIAETRRLGIPRAYGSYDELLADPEIEAVYIPLPNHLHVEWCARAARAGKHVLCEKPLALDAGQAASLLVVQQETGVLIAEAVMVRSHPQWRAVRSLVQNGRIGSLRGISYVFSYNNTDPANIRNIRAAGGGALLDIGCYVVNTARWLFESEPQRVFAFGERDPTSQVDRLTSGVLEFSSGHVTFSCATQQVPHERVELLGTKGRIELQAPFKAPPDRTSRLQIDDGRDVYGSGTEFIELPIADQFALQADEFSLAIRKSLQPENRLEDAISGMRVIDALFRSMVSGQAEVPR